MAEQRNKWVQFGNTFAENQTKYLQNINNKAAWDKMFLTCISVCELKLVQMMRNKFVLEHDDFIDLALEAATRIMNRYKKPKGYFIKNLANVCEFSLRDVMYTPKAQFEDRVLLAGGSEDTLYLLAENKGACEDD